MKLALALGLALFAASLEAAPRAWRPGDQADTVIVAWRPAVDRGTRSAEARRLGLDASAPKEALRAALALEAGGVQDLQWEGWDLSRIRLSTAGGPSVDRALASLTASPLVESAEPDARASLAATCGAGLPNLDDPLYTGGFQSGLTATAWPQAVAAYCSGTLVLRSVITVAVLDTGVDAHADLGTALIGGASFIASEPSTDDGEGHGTFVAGLIAANSGNASGLAGAFFDPFYVRILPVKVLDSGGNGSISTVLSGVQYALGAGARILNLSLTFQDGTESASLDRALVDARARGAVVVVATGNISGGNPSSATGYPASHPLVVAVGALGSGGLRAAYSKHGKVDLSAPGGDGGSCPCVAAPAPGACAGEIWSLAASATGCGFSDRFEAGAGTSFAAPLVAAAAALLLSQDPLRSPEAVLQRLIQSASATAEGPGYHSTTGWGRLNFYGALVQGAPSFAGSKLKAWNWPNPFSPARDGQTTLAIQGVSDSALTVRLFDAGGDLVKKWALPAGAANAGLQLIRWDGRNGQGAMVANGSYGLVVDGPAGRATHRVAVLQ